MTTGLDSVLVANRGEIAWRVIRTLRRLGVRSVAVHSEADADLPYVAEADEAVLIGGAAPADSYLDQDAVLAAARRTNVQAVHPGYGFLSENPGFARRVVKAGLVWIGPSPDAIALMGNKINARNLMAAAGVPVSPGTTEPVSDATAALAAARETGLPLMVKAAAGGGGMGMAVVHDTADLADALHRVRSFAGRVFGDDSVLLERYFPRVRHVEVQILGLPDGRVVALGERDCSVQRRHQKVIEETPSPGVGEDLRRRMLDAAVRAGEAVDYRGAGTVECLVDAERQEFFFLEMNTRLQVEHPVTEAVLGLDLVELQLRIAAGEAVDVADVRPRGHAIELRVNAEDPVRFLPGPGRITDWTEPTGPGVRVDAGYRAGNTVTPYCDSLLAKVVVHGTDRAEALDRARRAVKDFVVAGPKHNLPFLAELLDDPGFASGDYDTGLVGRMRGSGAG